MIPDIEIDPVQVTETPPGCLIQVGDGAVS